MDSFTNDPFAGSGDDASTQRLDTRDSLFLVARLRLVGEARDRQVRVRNLSAGGLMAEYADPIDSGAAVELDVRGLGWVPGRIAWAAAGRVGVAFDHPIDPKRARKPVGPSAAKPSPAVIKPLFPNNR
jgi:hypothetical protein